MAANDAPVSAPFLIQAKSPTALPADRKPLPPRTYRQARLARIVEWLDRQRQRAALAELDDRLLADIGISRAEATVESRKRI